MDSFAKAAWLDERGCQPVAYERDGWARPAWRCPGRVVFIEFRRLPADRAAEAVTERAWRYMTEQYKPSGAT